VLCWGLNAFSKPVSRTVVVKGFTIPLELDGGGGNAVEPGEEAPSVVGREVVVSAWAKSNWSSNALSKERLFPAAAGAVLGRSPNALSKSLTVATFADSKDDANGDIEAAKGLLSFAGGGKGLVLRTSVVAATTVVTGENIVSTVV
jgi:hypothetical protein